MPQPHVMDLVEIKQTNNQDEVVILAKSYPDAYEAKWKAGNLLLMTLDYDALIISIVDNLTCNKRLLNSYCISNKLDSLVEKLDFREN